MAPAVRMTEFVEQCRREWRRLDVPDPLADEMATDLAADLSDAEADGVSREEFLGSSAFDPTSFAASWAAERGIIPAPPSSKQTRRRPLFLVAFTALAAITSIVAALLLATGEPKVALATTRMHLASPPSAALATSTARHVLPGNAAAPIEWILLFLSIVALGFAAWLWSGWARPRPG